MLEYEGLGHGTIHTARHALSIILPCGDGHTVGKHQLIHWFIGSVYERNPPKPKYNRLVFNLFEAWLDNRQLSLKMLSYKVAILLSFVTGHKGQTIVALSLDRLEIERVEAVFYFKTLLKSNRTGDSLSSLHINVFRKYQKLSVIRAYMYISL